MGFYWCYPITNIAKAICGGIQAVKAGQAMLKGLQQQAAKQNITVAGPPEVKDCISSWLTLPFVSQLLAELTKFIELCAVNLLTKVGPLSEDSKCEVGKVTSTVEQDIPPPSTHTFCLG